MLAEAARGIARTGEYVPSRPPGYPLVELGLAPLVGLGPVATNAVTALWSVACALLIALLLSSTGARTPLACAAFFAATPVVWIASVSTIDYLWGLGLILAGLWAATRGWGATAGVAIALATLARLSSALWIAPVLMLLESWPARGRAFLIAFLLPATAWAVIAVGLGVGWVVPRWDGYPELTHVLHKAGAEVWGEAGGVFVALALLVLLPGLVRALREDRLARAVCAGTGLQLALFLAMPYESGYLVPFVAGLVLWIGVAAPPWLAWALVAAVTVSSLSGPQSILRDCEHRRTQEAFVESLVEAARELDRPTLLLCGQLYPMVRFELGSEEPIEDLELESAIEDETRLRAYAAEGIDIRYVPGIEPWYAERTGHVLSGFATPLIR